VSHAFASLERFVSHEMRMSHIYQPVMLLELHSSGGQASIRQIAEALQAQWHDGNCGDAIIR
jgi:ATP adenylyltransferase